MGEKARLQASRVTCGTISSNGLQNSTPPSNPSDTTCFQSTRYHPGPSAARKHEPALRTALSQLTLSDNIPRKNMLTRDGGERAFGQLTRRRATPNVPLVDASRILP